MDRLRLDSKFKQFKRFLAKVGDKKYRDAFVEANTRQSLAQQVRDIRGDMTQYEFAKLLGVTQSVVSERLENPSYEGWKVTTIINICQKTNRLPIIMLADPKLYFELTCNARDDSTTRTAIDDDVIAKIISN